MGKIKVLGLVYGSIGSSHTVRVLEIAKALRETGNFDIIFSGEGPYMKMVEDAGFALEKTRGLDAEENLKTMDKLIPKFYSKKIVKELFPIEDRLLREQKPDIIIRSFYRELAGIAAKQHGIFDVLVGQVNVCPYYLFTFVPPNVPKFAEAIISYANSGGRIEKMIRKSVGKELHRKSKELGLKIVEESYEGADADLVLLCDSEAVFPLSEKPKKYKYLGPLLVLNQSKSPEWEEKFVNDTRKKVVITSGSSGLQEKTNLFVEAFKNTNLAIALDTFSPAINLPGNFYGNCPFEINSVLPYADSFITHGGLGSTYLGLKHGVPMLGIYTHWEQSINCFTIENFGAGLSILKKARTPEAVYDKTYRLIYNSKYRKNAINLKEKLEKDSPLERAVKYINEGYEEFKKIRR